MNIRARTDRRRQYLLCGVCGLALGLILNGWNSSGTTRWIWLPTNWAAEYRPGLEIAHSATWRLSKHGYWNIRNGGETQPERARLVDVYRGEIDGWHPFLPGMIVCPVCKMMQEMDAETLRATNHPWPHRKARPLNPRPPDKVTPEPGDRMVLPPRVINKYKVLMERLAAHIS